MSRRVLVVIGSRTRENGYGVASGRRVADALRRHGWDVEVLHAAEGAAVMRRLLEDPPGVVVPVGFGPPCEDGHISAACRLAAVPCAGPTPASGGLMQDKSALSRLVDALFPDGSGVRSPRGCTITRGIDGTVFRARVRALTPPLLVKPAFSGSSEGLAVAGTHEEAMSAVALILDYEGKVLVQELEHPILSEVSCTVLDGAEGPHFLPIVELRREGELVLGPEEKFGPEGLGRHIIPARLDAGLVLRLREAVLTVHDAVGAVGLTRTDVLIRKDGELVILELNGIPGLLESSIACDAARAAGLPFDELCIRYLQSAFIPRAEPRVWEAG